MADFKLKDGDFVRTKRAVIASATVIEAGDLVALSAGLVIKAVAGSTAIAFCPAGSANGETITEITIGNDFTLLGTADANFAVTNKGAEVDLVVNATNQEIDLGLSATDVFKVGIAEDSGTVGTTTDVEVRINKPIF